MTTATSPGLVARLLVSTFAAAAISASADAAEADPAAPFVVAQTQSKDEEDAKKARGGRPQDKGERAKDQDRGQDRGQGRGQERGQDRGQRQQPPDRAPGGRQPTQTSPPVVVPKPPLQPSKPEFKVVPPPVKTPPPTVVPTPLNKSATPPPPPSDTQRTRGDERPATRTAPLVPAPSNATPPPPTTTPGAPRAGSTEFKRWPGIESRDRRDSGERRRDDTRTGSDRTPPDRTITDRAAQDRTFRDRTPRRLDAIKDSRRETVESGGRRTIIKEADNRVIVRENNRIFIQSDPNRRFDRFSRDARTRRLGDGTRLSIVSRPGGVEIHTITDRDGRLLRRFRRDRSGREITILDNRRRDRFGRPIAIGLGIGIGALIAHSFIDVPPPRLRIPREKYIVDYDRASDDDLYEALSAPPIDDLDRSYTLDEVLYSRGLRDRMRRIDHSSINFEFGAWEVEEGQIGKLERIARAMLRVIDRNPAEMFLVEGHTDAVGSDVDNLTLSDRRAEAVAEILTEEFGVPPENLTTQGYGEQFLKVETREAERLNRRVAFVRLTPLLSRRDER